MAPATLSAPSRLLSCEEAAQLLGTTAGTLSVWRCTKRYDLPYVKVGRSVKYRPEDVQAFIMSRTVSSSGQAN
jgi:excisionase family DNA binding protein